MGLLDGKKLVVTGVLTDASIAFTIARLAQEQGAELVLTSFGRPMRITERVARRLPDPPDVLELDVVRPRARPGAHRRARPALGPPRRHGALDRLRPGVVPRRRHHAGAGWDDVATALQVSAYSLRVLADVALPLMEKAGGGSIVGLDFDNSTQAFPAYDWMGVAKAALAATSRYLARDLGPSGIRVNLVAAGPDQDDRRQVDPRLRAVRGGLAGAVAARLGRR